MFSCSDIFDALCCEWMSERAVTFLVSVGLCSLLGPSRLSGTVRRTRRYYPHQDVVPGVFAMRIVWTIGFVLFFVFGAPIVGGLTMAGTNQTQTHETMIFKSAPEGSWAR